MCAFTLRSSRCARSTVLATFLVIVVVHGQFIISLASLSKPDDSRPRAIPRCRLSSSNRIFPMRHRRVIDAIIRSGRRRRRRRLYAAKLLANKLARLPRRWYRARGEVTCIAEYGNFLPGPDDRQRLIGILLLGCSLSLVSRAIHCSYLTRREENEGKREGEKGRDR